MIIAEIKPLVEILKYVENCERILLLGCSDCANVCSLNGEKELKDLPQKIKKERERQGKTIEVLEEVVVNQCKAEYVKFLKDFVDKVDAIVSLGCGAGVNLIADLFPEIEVFPGVDTLFCGVEIRDEYFLEKCRLCGNCIIGETAGLCPLTRCPKNLLNGPCGGVKKGMCEVKKDLPCVWYQIVKKLEKRGKIEKLKDIWGPKDWRSTGTEGVRKLKRIKRW